MSGATIVLALMLVGVAVLGASIWAWRKNSKVTISEMPPLRRTLWRWRWVIGVALGAGSYFLHLHYPADEYSLHGPTVRYTVYGVPFMSYAFDQWGNVYDGPLSKPALVLNFITWAMLPQLGFWVFGRREPKQPQTSNGA